MRGQSQSKAMPVVGPPCPVPFRDEKERGFCMIANHCLARSLLATCLLALAVGCSRPDAASTDHAAANAPIAIADDAGVVTTLSQPAQRVISIIPSVTDIFVALDATDQLVGRSDFDTHPSVADLPAVGGINASLESIVLIDANSTPFRDFYV